MDYLRGDAHRIRVTVDLVILGISCLKDHDTAKLMLVLALQRVNDLVGFVRLEIHLRVVDNVGIWRRGKTQVDFGVRIVRLPLHKFYPAGERDVRV